MLLLGSHHIIYFQRLRTGTLGVAEHMELGHIQAVNKAIGILKKFRSLPTCTDNDIHPDEGIRNDRTDFGYLGGKLEVS